ncbi:hypothetical protein M3Y99_01732600 [Aphelenchoides fujianensis]|nr:hypothetical protein M3Y99_01732600 [Aphelenchoides fujianensis]
MRRGPMMPRYSGQPPPPMFYGGFHRPPGFGPPPYAPYGGPPRMQPPFPHPPAFGAPPHGAPMAREHFEEAPNGDAEQPEQEQPAEEQPKEQVEPEPEQQPPPIVRTFPTRPQVFDQFMCLSEFPLPDGDDGLAAALLARNQQISPTSNEQTAISGLMARVKNALETISATDAIPSVKIDEFREVGSFKKGTMLTKHNVADLVVISKTLPTPETVRTLGNKVVEMLKAGGQPNEVFGVVPRDFGCEIAGTQAVLRLLVAVPADHLDRFKPDLHLNPEIIQEPRRPPSRILVRLIKDIKARAKGFAALDVWTIELLSHYCVTVTPDRSPLPLVHAFRRFFQLLSSGFLLHSSVAVADPSDQTRRINYGFHPSEADMICRTAQFITRLLLHEKFEHLLATGKTPILKDIGSENETDANLNIAPLKAAYNEQTIFNVPPADRFFSRPR